MNPNPKSIVKRLIPIIAVALLTVYNACKKHDIDEPLPVNDPVINEAKQWYEASYPLNAINKPALQTTDGSNADISQKIRPDWQYNSTYERLGAEVIETRIDASNTLKSAFKNNTTNKIYGSFEYSKSSFLFLKKGDKREAYVMTIIGDSSYLKNDLTKLSRNTYNKRDTNFSGMVVYTTPKGKYVNSWKYVNGKLVNPPGRSANVNTQSTKNKLTTMTNAPASCVDWWYYEMINGERVWLGYAFTICTPGEPVDGSPGGGNDSPPPPICPSGTRYVKPIAVNGNTSGGSEDPYDPSDPGFPPPTPQPPLPSSSPCAVQAPPPDQLPIDTSKLKKDFPCAAALIMELLKNEDFKGLMSPFAGRPEITFASSGNLPWNNSNGEYKLGETLTDDQTYNAKVTLSKQMLQNSSVLAIATAIIHESLHGLINYDVKMARYNQADGNITLGSWLYGMDSWISLYGLPQNYSNHYTMMEYYFDKSVQILGDYDGHAHSQKEYQMMMLFGLNTADSNATPTQIANLQNTYNQLLINKGITTSQLNTFWQTQLNAITNKLPTTGCN